MFSLPVCGVGFQSLVWELRSLKPLGAAKQKQNKYKTNKNERTTLKETTIPSMQSEACSSLNVVPLEAVPLRVPNAFDILPPFHPPPPPPPPTYCLLETSVSKWWKYRPAERRVLCLQKCPILWRKPPSPLTTPFSDWHRLWVSESRVVSGGG